MLAPHKVLYECDENDGPAEHRKLATSLIKHCPVDNGEVDGAVMKAGAERST